MFTSDITNALSAFVPSDIPIDNVLKVAFSDGPLSVVHLPSVRQQFLLLNLLAKFVETLQEYLLIEALRKLYKELNSIKNSSCKKPKGLELRYFA
jgi:hypothetical protein